MNFWIRIGVFNARSVRTFFGVRPNVSRLSRRTPLLETSLSFKAKAATFLKSLANYTEVRTQAWPTPQTSPGALIEQSSSGIVSRSLR
jgi:hypothetical protein